MKPYTQFCAPLLYNDGGGCIMFILNSLGIMCNCWSCLIFIIVHVHCSNYADHINFIVVTECCMHASYDAHSLIWQIYSIMIVNRCFMFPLYLRSL